MPRTKKEYLEPDPTESNDSIPAEPNAKGKAVSGNGSQGAPSAGPTVVGCNQCRERFPDYAQLRKHKQEVHGAF